MSTHHAFFCSDVVSGITSYLPTADILSLVMCGNSILNKLLYIHTERCLVHTTRDSDAFYSFLNTFRKTRYVYMDREYCNAPTYTYQMPANIERFVAPNTHISKLKFGSFVQYVSVYSINECWFDVPPEICTMQLVHFYNSYVTHIISTAHITTNPIYPTANVHNRYPRLREVIMNNCPLAPPNIQLEGINITYVCNPMDYICPLCGKARDNIITNTLDSYLYLNGTKSLTINGDFNKDLCHTIPSSVKSLIVFGKMGIGNACDIVSRLSETILKFSFTVCNITDDSLVYLSEKARILHLYCDGVSTESVISIVATNCHKFQFDRLVIEGYHNKIKISDKYTRMLAGHYHACTKFDYNIEFERIRARN